MQQAAESSSVRAEPDVEQNLRYRTALERTTWPPNLLWELMRTRREKLTAQQLLTRNVSERIIDKDNHARDALKYLVMSLPEPAMVARDRVREIVTPLAESGDLTSALIRYRQHTEEEPYEPARFVSRRSMMFRRR
jgi:hypothetical protein